MLKRALILGSILLVIGSHTEAQLPALDRTQLPKALEQADLRHLSSGALLLLNRENNLVQPPAPGPATPNGSALAQQAPIALDPRVGANIRLGDDPPALPLNMRAQAEPHIARSPVNPDVLVATFQEGRFTDGGAVDCGYSVSNDGGLTWSRALIPGVTQAVGGPYYRATDPVAGLDLNNRIFLNIEGATDASFNTGIVLVSRSTNGGQTFGAPAIVYRPPNSTIFPDKNWMAINTFPGTATVGRIVVTFTEFFGKVSPIARSYSNDSGITWSAPAFINGLATSSQGSQPVFLPNGKLAVVYWNFGTNASPGERIEVVVSNDGGITFATPRLVRPAVEYNEPRIRTGGFLPSATTDRKPGAGDLYVVYQSILGGSPRILFTKSTDSGSTWTFPIAISDNPFGSGVFNPAIAASPDGRTLTVGFYDHRANPGSSTLVDMYLAQSFDGGSTWQPNIRLTSVSTDASLAPLTDTGYMLGDYLAVAESTTLDVPAIPVWVDTRTGNPDPFVARVGIAPQVNFTAWRAARFSLAQINNPAFGAAGSDPDLDKEDNLSEFNSGTDPRNPNSVVRSARPQNISTRAFVGTNDSVLIGGFIIGGAPGLSRRVLVRAIGPSLAANGVQGALDDPVLELHNNNVVIFNDNWKDSQAAAIQATGAPPTDDRESAILQTLATGRYTALMRGKGDATGVGLIEVYDLEQSSTPRLSNISARGVVGLGDNVMIGGFIIGGGLGVNGHGSGRVIVRGIGPTLTQSGISGALQDPVLELHNSNGTLVAFDDNWKDAQQSEIAATGLAPKDDRESAIATILAQGTYTAILRGRDGTTGIALVEVYNVP